MKNSRTLESIYPLNKGTCRNVWQNKNCDLSGFGDANFKVNNSVKKKILRHASDATHAEKHIQSIIKKDKFVGAMYVEPVD